MEQNGERVVELWVGGGGGGGGGLAKSWAIFIKMYINASCNAKVVHSDQEQTVTYR